jgi:hypothetical protein
MSRNLSTTCPGCGGPKKSGARACQHCYRESRICCACGLIQTGRTHSAVCPACCLLVGAAEMYSPAVRPPVERFPDSHLSRLAERAAAGLPLFPLGVPWDA